MYVVHEDGYDSQIWAGDDEEPENKKKQKKVHMRFLETCGTERTLLDPVRAMHLTPFPQRVPMVDFQSLMVDIAVVDNQFEAELFKEIYQLYGGRIGTKENVTTHIVVQNETKVSKSKRL